MRMSWQDTGATRILAVLLGAFFILMSSVILVTLLPYGRVTYSEELLQADTYIATTTIMATSTPEIENKVAHIPTPLAVKAVYYTSWAAGNGKFRRELFDLASSTEINSVVIDVKDYTGRISFQVEDPELQALGASENRIPDIKEFIAELHNRGLYVIARISSFQDSYLIKVHPEWAVHTLEGSVWQDYKGVKWLDPGAKPVWDYLVSIGKEAYAFGFDELNFDYIRYPSDGNLKDISYSWSNGRTRQEVMKSFFAYLREEFGSRSIPISVDLFGLTTSADDDMGIGQILTDALKYFDYVAPMVYPSHFATGYIGYAKPAQHPYEVIRSSMSFAVSRATATTTTIKLFGDDLIASTTPQLYSKVAVDISKLRPWLQAFDLGAIYTPAMVRDQIRAANDLGLTSWMLWNAGSVYDKKALLPK